MTRGIAALCSGGLLVAVSLSAALAGLSNPQGNGRGFAGRGFTPAQGNATTSLPADGDPTTDPLFRFDANTAASLIQGGLSLDGSSAVKEALSSDPIGSYPFTVAVCFTPTSVTTDFQAVWQLASDSEDTTFHLLLGNSGVARIRASVGGTLVDEISSGSLVTNNQSNWVFATFRAAGLTIAVNDTYYSKASTAPQAYPADTFDRLNIGAIQYNGGGASTFCASGTVVHQLYVIGREVSREEVRDVVAGVPFEEAVASGDRIRNWRLNSATDTVASKTLSTFTGSGATFADGDVVYAMSDFGSVERGSYQTTASANYLRLATLPSGLDGDDYTIMWFSGGGYGTGVHSQISIGDGSGASYEDVDYTNSTLRHRYDAGSSGLASYTGSVGTQLLDGHYRSMAFTKRASNDREIYSQGVSVGTSTFDRDNAADYSELHVGATNVGTSSTGKHARLMVWSPALTDEQVRLANEGADPRNIGATCVAYYKLADLTDELGGADLVAVGSPTTTTDWVSNSFFAFRQRDSTKRPSYGTVSSKGALVFDGTDEVLVCSKQANPLMVSTYTAVMTRTVTDTTNGTYFAAFDPADLDHFKTAATVGGGDDGLDLTHQSVTATPRTVAGGDVSTATAQALTFISNGATSSVRVDGSATSGDLSAASPLNTSNMYLGAGVTTGPAATDFFDGSIGRLVILPRVVGTSELTLREDQ